MGETLSLAAQLLEKRQLPPLPSHYNISDQEKESTRKT